MSPDDILARFQTVADNPLHYAREWKEQQQMPVVASFPMHFPCELVHAAGCLPLILQESENPITVGHGMIQPFYCGYTRSIVDQVCSAEFDFLDAIMFGDHCVQILGAADIVRAKLPDTRVHFYQLISSMSDAWSLNEARKTFTDLKEGLEEMTGHTIDEASARASVQLFNRNRQLLRRLYSMRSNGKIALSARQMQYALKSSMVMDKASHNELMDALLVQLESSARPQQGVKLFLSGHFCQAPKPEVLDLIEDCGAIVVGDDLYHGTRFISTDVDQHSDILTALAQWYLARNLKVPCATRVDQNADWEEYLLHAMDRHHAEGMVVLMAKFCEPHMYYYPEIKEAFERRGVPHLLVETEHEMAGLEGLRTRVESFVEMVKRQSRAAATQGKLSA